MLKGLFGTACGVEHIKVAQAEVKKAVADGKAVLVDVRESEEWKDAHPAGGPRTCHFRT